MVRNKFLIMDMNKNILLVDSTEFKSVTDVLGVILHDHLKDVKRNDTIKDVDKIIRRYLKGEYNDTQ